MQDKPVKATDDSVFINCDDDVAQSWSMNLPQIVDEAIEDYSVEISVKLGALGSLISYTQEERRFE